MFGMGSCSLFPPFVSCCLPVSRRCPVGVPSVRCWNVNSKLKSNLRCCMYSCCIHARHECDAMCSFVFCDRVSLFHSRSLFLPLVSRCLPQSRRCPVGVPSVRCEIVNSKMKSNSDSACMLVAFIHAMSATHCAHVCSVIVFLCFICVLRSRRWCLVACRCPVGVPSVSRRCAGRL